MNKTITSFEELEQKHYDRLIGDNTTLVAINSDLVELYLKLSDGTLRLERTYVFKPSVLDEN